MGSQLVVARALMRSAMVPAASCSRSRLELMIPALRVGTAAAAPSPPVGGHATSSVSILVCGVGLARASAMLAIGQGLGAGAHGRSLLKGLLLAVGGGDEVADALLLTSESLALQAI